MLKITVTDETATLRVTVEGELTGPQADVLEANWRNAVLLRQQKNVVVDLCGVTSIDAAGKEVLRHMINSGAELSAFGPKTAYIIECLRNAKERGRA